MAAPPRKKAKIDWAKVDWGLENVEISRRLGVSRELVRQHRLRCCPDKSQRKPRHVALEPTVKRTAEKYGVPYLAARQWHQTAGRTVEKGRPKFVLPGDYVPETLAADAARLGVDINTVQAAMMRQGMPRNQAGKRRGRAPFVLPADYVPGNQKEDAKRFGVSTVTLWKARRRSLS